METFDVTEESVFLVKCFLVLGKSVPHLPAFIPTGILTNTPYFSNYLQPDELELV